MLSIYFKEQEKLEEEFGEKSVILWENGSFMEVYEIDTKNKKVGKCIDLSKDLNMIVSLQNKKETHSIKNCKMLGFPTVSLSKNLDVLLKNGWTISIWHQHDIKGKDKKERKHFKTFTTTINLNDNENLRLNNLMSLYLYNYKCSIDKIEKNDLNINILDLNTGIIKSYLFNNEINITYVELNELINKYEIMEIIYLTNNDDIDINKIINNTNIKIYKKENNKEFKNINYQKEFINKYFNNNNDNLLNYPDIIYSLINLLNFVSKCDVDILNKITNPELIINKYNTIINYDTIYQLNLINNEYTNKYKSIYNLIDNCVTLIGKRLLKQRLLNPIIDINELNLRYEKIDILKNMELYKNFTEDLKHITDIERIFRIISLKRCELIKFASFVYSIKAASKLLKKINKNQKLKELFLNNNKLKEDIEEINDYLENMIDVDILKKYNMCTIKENFFKNNNDNELLEIEKIINNNKKNIEEVIKKISFSEENSNSKEWIKVLQTEKDGYYLFTSKSRYDKLIKENNYNNNKYNFTTIKLSNGIKFYNDDIKEYSNKILEATDLLTDKLKIKYLNFIEEFTNLYTDKINKLINFLADFDISYSNAITSIMYNFTRPNINNKKNKLEAKNVRHLLIELYNSDEVYKANDILLNNDTLGYLILAPNSCGKSSYLRSIGISLVLAQMGSYVPANEYIYNPYNKILCKISSVDNIYESKSKFIQDITHMNMFIENADDKTLLLVDEFLNSTEEYSAAALTAASINELINKKSNFVYTSHINSIIDLLKDNKQIKFKHFDYKIIENNKIIFDRLLKDGPPQQSLYGIEISQNIINNKLFLNKAYELRNKLLNKNNNLLNTKLSHYNKTKVIDKCENCKSEIDLETHHKIEQHNANEFGIIITENNIFHKNSKHNLQILCKKCHKKIHK